MEAAAALADLTEISSQIASVAVFERDGATLASTPAGDGRADRLVASARELLAAAEGAAASAGRELTQLEVTLPDASVFVVRDGGLAIAATTSAQPTTGLVLYDLRTCLRALSAEPEPASKPRRRRAKTADA